VGLRLVVGGGLMVGGGGGVGWGRVDNSMVHRGMSYSMGNRGMSYSMGNRGVCNGTMSMNHSLMVDRASVVDKGSNRGLGYRGIGGGRGGGVAIYLGVSISISISVHQAG